MLGEDFGYGPHYYGPYSARVAAANQELKTLGYLSETKAVGKAADALGFPIARHDFRLTPDGQTVIAEKKRRLQDEWERVKSAVLRLMDAGQLNYMEISIAAKAYFLLDQRGQAAGAEEIVRAVRDYLEETPVSVPPRTVSRAFSGSKVQEVTAILETLTALGQARKEVSGYSI
jgi:hypothetical protein